MQATYQRDFLQTPRVLLFFIKFNILTFIIICRQKKTHLNPGSPPALQPAPLPQPPPSRKRKPPNPWVMPWILQSEERGCYRTLGTEEVGIYQSFQDYPIIQNFYLSYLANYIFASYYSNFFLNLHNLLNYLKFFKLQI